MRTLCDGTLWRHILLILYDDLNHHITLVKSSQLVRSDPYLVCILSRTDIIICCYAELMTTDSGRADIVIYISRPATVATKIHSFHEHTFTLITGQEAHITAKPSSTYNRKHNTLHTGLNITQVPSSRFDHTQFHHTN